MKLPVRFCSQGYFGGLFELQAVYFCPLCLAYLAFEVIFCLIQLVGRSIDTK